MREELARVLEQTPLWDRRASVLQVTDATNGFIRVRVLVTAVDAPTLFDLRCYVREHLVDWVHRETPGALPVQRVLIEDAETPPAAPASRDAAADTGSTGLFTGSPEAEQRARAFTQAIHIVPGAADDGAERPA